MRRLLPPAAALAVALALTSPARGTLPGRSATAVRLAPLVRLVHLGGTGTPPTTAGCRARSSGAVACYDPAQLRVAYDLAPLYARGDTGRGETIVLVDAYGSPTIRADLATFDADFALPAPPSFRVLTPRGAIPPYTPTGKDRYAWAQESTLDVEWAHALAPGASILLVETPTDEVEGTSGFPDIVAAEGYVLAHHLGQVISQSFGATEATFTGYGQVAPLRSAFLAARRDHVTVLASSGDLGATDYEADARHIYPHRVTSWPASDPLVTAVGGTKLDLADDGAPLQPAVAWNDTYAHTTPSPDASGGGRSVLFARPSFQDSLVAVTGTHRGVPDVAMSAACSGLVDVYLSAPGPPRSAAGWQGACGTSEAAPLFAAVVAIADQVAGHPLGLLDPALYAMSAARATGLVAVTSGDNTVSFRTSSGTTTVTGFRAGPGYNLVTGLGTVDAAAFVPELVAAVRAAG